jgi:hypothetical protein
VSVAAHSAAVSLIALAVSVAIVARLLLTFSRAKR